MNHRTNVIGDSFSRLFTTPWRSWLALVILSLGACSEGPSTFTVQTVHEIPIDASVKNYTFCMKSYNDDVLLYMQGDDNAILSIDLKNEVYQKHILDKQGPNSVPQVRGFSLLNEELLLSSSGKPIVYLLDKNLQYKGSLDFRDYKGLEYVFTVLNSRVNKEVYEVEGVFIFPQELYLKGRVLDEQILNHHNFMIRVDTSTRTITPLDGFEYPGSYLLEGRYNPVFTTLRNGDFIIASPLDGHEIAVYNILEKKTSIVKLQSQYLNSISDEQQLVSPIEKLVRSGRYVNMYYDRMRKVYYRVVKHENHDPEIDINMSSIHYRNTFSIMIIDEKFNVLDEMIIDNWNAPKYVMENMFMSKQGLKISMDNPFSNTYNEDNIEIGLLEFKLF